MKTVPMQTGLSNKGTILLDILVGLFILGAGLAVIFSVIQTSAAAGGQAQNLREAVNLSSSTMEEVLSEFERDKTSCYAYLNSLTQERIGKFNRTIQVEWESQNLMLILVETTWEERGEERHYRVESLFYVRE
jgi:type II secretory pathway pseudopilin PulG